MRIRWKTEVEPVSGDTLQVSLDYNIQEYAQQVAEKVMEEKQADAVVILILNPKTGEIYACVNAPEFDLNAPFTLPEGTDLALNDEEKQAMLNQMWRNRSINDTYEPGSIFKVFTASAALEEGVVKEEDTFTVLDTSLWKTAGSGVRERLDMDPRRLYRGAEFL